MLKGKQNLVLVWEKLMGSYHNGIISDVIEIEISLKKAYSFIVNAFLCANMPYLTDYSATLFPLIP